MPRLEPLKHCTLCPRQCGADRTNPHPTTHSFCGASERPEVASVCLHRGEEPPLNPITNVFFSHCNLQCIYCQNWQISGPTSNRATNTENIESLADRIVPQLSPITPLLGLVTAAHYAHLIPPLLEAIHARRSSSDAPLTVVYNSSGYESIETLRSLEGLIDIYLPDFKYMDSALAKTYSHAANYPEVASAAINEMIRQVGIGLKTDDKGIAYRGIIVRHLVLPGHTSNSLAVLDHLASISSLHSPFSNLHLSLMAQYFPPHEGLPAPLNRTVSPEEYALVVHRAEELGFSEGWIQELTAQNNYRPDFTHPNPFQSQQS